MVTRIFEIEPSLLTVNFTNTLPCIFCSLQTVGNFRFFDKNCTNAVFERDAIRPLYAGELPEQIKELVDPHVANHERILKAAILCDFDLVVEAFLEDPQVKGRASREQVEELVRDMLRSTAKYLPEGWKKYL